MKYGIGYIILFLINLQTVAQVGLRSTGNLQIHPGGSLKIVGNFDNSSAATLINNGDLEVAGHIVNDQAGMNAGTGTLHFVGTGTQTLSGTQSFFTNNLVSNNSSGINLDIDLHVGGLHTYTSGLINSSITPSYIVYEAGSSWTGAGDTRHVNGWVKKKGDTDFSFPIGDGNYFRPAAIQNLSAVSEFNAHYYTPTQNISNVTNPIRLVKANEYWQINRVSGGNASVELNWDHSRVAMNNVLLADIAVTRYSGSWIDQGGTAVGNVFTTGSISSNLISAFGSFTLGYKSYPVPLKLISFTGERKSGNSILNWTTENEQLVDHFELQRSYDGNLFSSIGSVPARNLASLQRYTYTDPSPLNGVVYYRLLSIDMDGKFSYSSVVVLTDKISLTNSFLVPNPVRNSITIFNRVGVESQVEYRLFSTNGQLIIKGDILIGANGGTTIPLPVRVTRGIYFLELQNNKVQFRQKILVE